MRASMYAQAIIPIGPKSKLSIKPPSALFRWLAIMVPPMTEPNQIQSPKSSITHTPSAPKSGAESGLRQGRRGDHRQFCEMGPWGSWLAMFAVISSQTEALIIACLIFQKRFLLSFVRQSSVGARARLCLQQRSNKLMDVFL